MSKYLASPDVSDCIKDPSGNILDAVTFNPIQTELLVKMWGGKTPLCFSVDTLYRYYVDSGSRTPINPFTKQELTDNVKARVLQYGKDTELNINLTAISFKFPYYKQVGELIAKIIGIISQEGEETQTSLLNIDIQLADGTSLYSMDLEEQVNGDQNLNICLLKSEQTRKEYLNKLYGYLEHKINDVGTNHYHLFLVLQNLLNEYSIIVTILLDDGEFESMTFYANGNVSYIDILKEYYRTSHYPLSYVLTFAGFVLNSATGQYVRMERIEDQIAVCDRTTQIVLQRETFATGKHIWLDKLRNYISNLLSLGERLDEIEIEINDALNKTDTIKAKRRLFG